MWIYALLLGAAVSQMTASCEQGEYEVRGNQTGKAITMDYSNSGLSTGTGGETILTLTYNVPTMLFYNTTVKGTSYNRAVQVTFHDATGGSSPSENSTQCYTRRDGSLKCPTSYQNWTITESGCDATLVGALSFDNLMNGDMDASLIAVRQETTSVNNVAGTPTWEIYMGSMIETWVPYSETSELSGDGNLDFNNGAQTMPTDHLTITTELHSFYHIPFRISIPQQIEIEANEIRSSAQLVALYAIVDQNTVEINFDTTSGAFAVADIILRTQVQYPFALIPVNGAQGAPTISLDTDATTTTNIASIAFTGNGDDSCLADGITDGGYCEQDWAIRITPNQCDISGSYVVDFYAYCFTTDDGLYNTTADGCALDTKYDQTSNRWTGYKTFSISAQEFCPTILDEVHVEGTFATYASDDLTEVAVPGSNVFVNDHVYFEATFTTSSLKDAVSFGDNSLDDSLIEFVRPYDISMRVQMPSAPLQYTVNKDNGDVTETTATDYTVSLCTVAPLTFPYTGTNTDCLTTGNMGWNAINTLAFGKVTATGSNTIDANEVSFSLRLDERVIPVDHPNSPSTITISMDVEIYYIGNTNPARRRMTIRRDLQEDLSSLEEARHQNLRVAEVLSVPRRPVSYCPLKTSLAYTGFHLSMIADPMELPTHEDINDHVMATRHQLSQYLDIPTDQLHIFQVDRCIEESCTQLHPTNGGKLDNSAQNTVDYFVDIRNKDAAIKLQDDLYNSVPELLESPFMYKKALKDMNADHCHSELQSTFNDYRMAQDAPELQVIEESSAAMFSVFVLGVLALLY